MSATVKGTPNANAGNTVTIPAHAAGDLIVIFAYRDGSTTAPDKPSAGGTVPTWTDINAGSGNNSNSSRTAYAVASASNHTSGTWTNATGMIAVVLQGVWTSDPIGGAANGGANQSNNVTGYAVTLDMTDGTSALLNFYGHRNVTAWSAAPSGYTRQCSVATEVALNTKDTTTTDGAQAQACTASTGGSRSEQVEVKGQPAQNDGAGSGAYTWAASPVGSKPLSGAASGDYTWAASPDGEKHCSGTASDAYTWAASAEGVFPAHGAAKRPLPYQLPFVLGVAGAYTWAGSATGAQLEQAQEGSASGTYTWSASPEGAAAYEGSTDGAYTWAGSAEGSNSASGESSGAYTWAGSAEGERAPEGSASDAYTWAASPEGVAAYEGSASGAYTWDATPVGEKPPDINSGHNHTDYGWAASPAGEKITTGSTDGAYTWAGSAEGIRAYLGSTSGDYGWAGSAEGAHTHYATAAGAYAWAGLAVGFTPVAGIGATSGTYGWHGVASGMSLLLALRWSVPSGARPRVLPDEQIVSLHTYSGITVWQFGPSDMTGLKWTRERHEVSLCDLTVPSLLTDSDTLPEIVPWVHWLSVWDGNARDLLWTGPVQKLSAKRDSATIKAKDCAAYLARTRTPLTKRWDSTDPAVVARDLWMMMVEAHGLHTKPIMRPNPDGGRYAVAITADARTMDAEMNDLAQMGLDWTVVSGVPVLGPVPGEPITTLGEDDFIGEGLELIRDGSTSFNDVLLRGQDSLARARYPMHGLNLQSIVNIDSMFGVTDVTHAASEYARYTSKIRDAVSLGSGAVLHPEAPVRLDQLIPSAMLIIGAFGLRCQMQLDGIEVNVTSDGAAVSLNLESTPVTEPPELDSFAGEAVSGARR